MSETLQQAWRQTISQWKTTLFTDSPQGKTLFAAGVAMVLERWRDDPSEAEWQRLYDELDAFVTAYMAESRERS